MQDKLSAVSHQLSAKKIKEYQVASNRSIKKGLQDSGRKIQDARYKKKSPGHQVTKSPA